MSVHLDRGSLDITGRGRDLRDVLQEVCQSADLACDLPPEVQGTATLDLHGATVRQALDLLLGSEFTYTVGPHDRLYIHKAGTTWRPGWEEPAA